MRRKELALAALFLFAAVWAFAQVPGTAPSVSPAPTPASPVAPGPSPAQNPQAPVGPATVPAFQFQIRTAFMLTPSMVATIQSASQRTQDAKSAQSSPSGKDSAPAWNEPVVRDVGLAASLGVKIQGDQLLAMVVFMPVELAKKAITLLVQNQVYARSPDNSIQLNTSVHTIRIPLGSVFYYYPMGGDAKQGAPVVIEILVNQK